MTTETDLSRFIKAQERDYEVAFREIKNGRKRSHWMWYIFPQLQGLGFSETSRYYAIKNKEEAAAFLHHPLLGKRLISICEELLNLEGNNATLIFGSPDDVKLKSCATLFSLLPGAPPVFDTVLKKYFGGMKDEKTARLLNK